MLQILNQQELEFFLAFMWVFWKDRNLLVFHKTSKSIELLIDEAVSDIEEFQKCQVINQATVKFPPAAIRWIPPKSGEIKLNVDAAIWQNRLSCAVGRVFRDSDGVVLAAL